MIIGIFFDGDSDNKLKMLQHRCYYNILRDWITMAGVRRLIYRMSPEWSEVTKMWELFRETGRYDHRSIQMPHDLIAARFRMVAQEMTLPDDEKEEAWYTFFKAEAAEWLEHDDFLRCFMIALSAEDSAARYNAEEAMFESMRRQYRELNLEVSV